MSRYTISERPDGFDVHAPGRIPVSVDLKHYYWLISCQTEFGPIPNEIGLYAFHTLVSLVAGKLMYGWQPPEHEKGRPRWTGLHAWAVTKTCRALANRLKAQWERLLGTVDKEVLGVHRAIFRSTFSDYASVMGFSGLYERPVLMRDIQHYRAAACAATTLFRLAWVAEVRERLRSPQWQSLSIIDREQQMNALLTEVVDCLGERQQLDALEKWITLFSPTGRDYRSLNRTLSNLPGGVPANLLCHLGGWRLERPVTNRLELILLLCYAREYPKDGGGLELFDGFGMTELAYRPVEQNRLHDRPGLVKVYQYATADQIRKAMDRVSEDMGTPLSPRRWKDVNRMVMYLLDFPEDHHGSIIGLANKAVRWHARERVRHANQERYHYYGYPPNTPTALPPIPLPSEAGIRFLTRVEEVIEEGKAMDHCVAHYAGLAVTGLCFLFHVDYSGEQATVEVNARGQVVQSFGPKNCLNKASRYGEVFLERWGGHFPAPAGQRTAIPGVEMFGEPIPERGRGEIAFYLSPIYRKNGCGAEIPRRTRCLA